ncbi:P-loop containing nucleoside triphosphate hydrolase protein [Linnemannia elongata]|nr:P-loop containing nucleoside triphosphate hydrolase protein [Linnemannia elongata]
MTSITGTAKKAASSWGAALYHNYIQPVSVQLNQAPSRGVRTRAGFRRIPSSQDRAPYDRPALSESVEGTAQIDKAKASISTTEHPMTTSDSVIVKAPTSSSTRAPPTRRSTVHRGFPTTKPDRSDRPIRIEGLAPPSLKANRPTTSKSPAFTDQQQPQQQQERPSGSKNNKSSSPTPPASTKPVPEKFPKKLQAFPFVPGATTGELTKAHKFFFSPAEFVKSATNLSMIPDNTMIPEVAFVGRSNIGKSSLINGLVNRNGLVKTSSKPGHTRMMNFFKLGDKLSLVDMPGYGWKSRDEWGGMIVSYLQNRKNLRRIYILVDPSHGLKESDSQIMKLLDSSGLSYQVVLTKMDRLSKTKYSAAKAEIEAELVKGAICCFPLVLGVSSKTKDGLDELRAAIVKAGQLTL